LLFRIFTLNHVILNIYEGGIMKGYIGMWLAILFLSLTLFSCSESGRCVEKEGINYWKGNMFIQPNIDISKYGDGIIRAKVDSKWQEFKIRELPDGFMEWNLSSRLKDLEGIKKGKMPGFAGPHSGMVASYGGMRKDTEFSINNAVKGTGLVPKKEKINNIIKTLEETWNAPIPEKIDILKGFYEDEDMFDRTKLSSLELYSTKDFQTHTFLNIMANPAVAVVFLDIPSYEVRAICRLVHPEDETADEEEKDICRYVNMIHDYFHGESPRKSIVMIFNVIQVFDNSPRAGGRGMRVVP